jgi:diguanylate cyclase (GGDEF)-like protein
MREGRSVAQWRRRILLPSFVAAGLPFVLLWLPAARWHPAPLVVAGTLTLVIGVIGLRAPWERLPGWTPSVLAFAYLIVVALLRAAGGPSGVAPMVLLPVFWLGVFGTRRQLWCLLVGVALLFAIPLILVGGADYPPSAWRAAILFIAASGIVGTTVQALVTHVRDQERERDRLLDRLDGLAHTDVLTGLANRRAWDAELDRGLARARRTSEPLSVAVIDIDRFKAVNDVHGHSGGDSLLQAVARKWAAALRPDDVLARIGGDEFALLMPACTEAEAGHVTGRLREHMPKPYSCSVGLATWDRAESAGSLMGRADNALYDAKREGGERGLGVGQGGERSADVLHEAGVVDHAA